MLSILSLNFEPIVFFWPSFAPSVQAMVILQCPWTPPSPLYFGPPWHWMSFSSWDRKIPSKLQISPSITSQLFLLSNDSTLVLSKLKVPSWGPAYLNSTYRTAHSIHLASVFTCASHSTILWAFVCSNQSCTEYLISSFILPGIPFLLFSFNK